MKISLTKRATFAQQMVQAVLQVLGLGGRWIQYDMEYVQDPHLADACRALLRVIIAPSTAIVANCVVFDYSDGRMEGDVEIGVEENGELLGRGGYRCYSFGSGVRTTHITLSELRT